jgi:O-antigen ligase
MLRSAEPAPAAAAPAAPPGTHGSPLALGASIVGLTGLAVVTFLHPSASRIYTWPFAAIVTGLWLLPVAALFHGLIRPGTWRLPPGLITAGLVVLCVATFLSAALSPFASASLPRLWPTLGGTCLYLILHHRWSTPSTAREHRLDRIAWALGLAGIAFALVSLIQWSGGSWPLPWGSRNTAPFGHSIYTAGAIVLLLPWIVLQTWTARGLVRLPWLLGVIVSLVVLASTSSRGGVLALLATGTGAVGVILVRGRWSWQRKLILGLAVLVTGAVAVLTNPRLRELVVHRQWSESSRESNAQRRAMIAAGVKLGLERPVLGWGPGTIPLVYPKVRAALDGGTENILQLHNTPAQIFATTGALGLLGLALLLLGAASAAFHAPPTTATSAAAASLFGYALLALTDHQLDVPVFSALAVAGLALLTSALPGLPREIAPRPAFRLTLVLVFALVAGVALHPTFFDLRARHHYETALTALEDKRPADFLRALDQATEATPHDPYFDHQAAAWLLEHRNATPDRSRQTMLADDARQRLERSLATEAHLEFAHFNLGWLLLDRQQPAVAIRHFTAAARLVPDKGGVYFGLGLAYELSGHRAPAVRCFALEIINDPRHLTSPAWELPTLAALAPAVREEVQRLHATLQNEFPPAAAVAAWTRWWWGAPITPAELPRGFNRECTRFLAALPTILRREPLDIVDAPWAKAYAAWRDAAATNATADAAPFLAVAGGDNAFAAALAGRARYNKDDFRAFLTAPTGDEAAMLVNIRRARIGYGMLALHPEGPPLSDLYLVQENRAITDLAAGLFPAKGWLPGRFLLALLPETP